MNLKAVLVTPGDKVLHYFDTNLDTKGRLPVSHYYGNKGGYIDDISGAYSTYFLSGKNDKALILSPQYGIVNISWYDYDNKFVTMINNKTGETKTVAID